MHPIASHTPQAYYQHVDLAHGHAAPRVGLTKGYHSHAKRYGCGNFTHDRQIPDFYSVPRLHPGQAQKPQPRTSL